MRKRVKGPAAEREKGRLKRRKREGERERGKTWRRSRGSLKKRKRKEERRGKHGDEAEGARQRARAVSERKQGQRRSICSYPDI